MSHESFFELNLLRDEDIDAFLGREKKRYSIIRSTRGRTRSDWFKVSSRDLLNHLNAPAFMRFLSEEYCDVRHLRQGYRLALPEEWDNEPREYSHVDEMTAIRASDVEKVLLELEKIWDCLLDPYEGNFVGLEGIGFYENLNDAPESDEGNSEEFQLSAYFSMIELLKQALQEGLAAVYVNENFSHVVKI